jgi:hypothetical protein
MITANGAPQVTPPANPDKISGSSSSTRAVESSLCPGALRLRNARSPAGSILIPAGKPSTLTPIAGECDCPKIDILNFFPYCEDTLTAFF